MNEYKEPTIKLILDRIAPMVLMNMLFLICCIPVVTIGPAWCGLYRGIRYFVRGGKWFEGFRKGFLSKFLPTALLGTLFHGFVVYLLYNTISIGFYQISGFLVPFLFSAVLAVLSLMLTGCSFILQTYHPSSGGQWMKDAFDLAAGMPLQSLLIGVLMFLPAVLLVCFTFSVSLLILVMLTCYYSIVALTATLLFRKKLRELFAEQGETE